MQADAPQIAGISVPVLLYADDAMLLCRTLVGLQRLMDKFGIFIASRKLLINKAKTFAMVCDPKPKKCKTFYIDSTSVETVNDFVA